MRRLSIERCQWLAVTALAVVAWSPALFARQGAIDPAAEVLALEQKIEDAIVRGDVAFVDRVTPSDFSFVHGETSVGFCQNKINGIGLVLLAFLLKKEACLR